MHYSHQLVDNRCLFTGVSIDSEKRGEHVIPRWMVRDYGLKGARVELGSKGAFTKVAQFTAPAVKEANGEFAKLEDRIKRDQAAVSDDEMHLWLMKLMSGMLWDHCRLATNVRPPECAVTLRQSRRRNTRAMFPRWFSRMEAGRVSSKEKLGSPSKLS